MIDEDRTMQLFGYVSNDLSPHSGKKIVCVCEECGAYRVRQKSKYRVLCGACNRVSKSVGDKISKSKRGRALTQSHCQKIRESRIGMSFTEEHKKNLSISHMGSQSGENSPHWKGGITKWRVRLLQSAPYKRWREAIFKRDNYTCQLCNKRGGTLQAHHIVPVRDTKNTLLILDINNGVTLCKDCHTKLRGNEYNFIDIFREIILNATII